MHKVGNNAGQAPVNQGGGQKGEEDSENLPSVLPLEEKKAAVAGQSKKQGSPKKTGEGHAPGKPGLELARQISFEAHPWLRKIGDFHSDELLPLLFARPIDAGKALVGMLLYGRKELDRAVNNMGESYGLPTSRTPGVASDEVLIDGVKFKFDIYPPVIKDNKGNTFPIFDSKKLSTLISQEKEGGLSDLEKQQLDHYRKTRQELNKLIEQAKEQGRRDHDLIQENEKKNLLMHEQRRTQEAEKQERVKQQYGTALLDFQAYGIKADGGKDMKTIRIAGYRSCRLDLENRVVIDPEGGTYPLFDAGEIRAAEKAQYAGNATKDQQWLLKQYGETREKLEKKYGKKKFDGHRKKVA